MKKNGKISLISALFLAVIFLIGTAMAAPRALKACRDGIDNDGDGYTDMDDPGCTDKNDLSELDPTVECDDGLDNDGDGVIDYYDNGCSGPADNDETDCGDGVCEGVETSGTCPQDCGYPDSCSDTDYGNYPLVFGTISGYYNDELYSNDDYCIDAGNIMEYYCNGNYGSSQQQSCGTDTYGSEYCAAGNLIYKDYTDYFCSNGACDFSVTPIFQEDCDASDGYGSNYCIYDSVYRDYNDYYCSGGACGLNATPEMIEFCEFGCTAGTCDLASDSCLDTDGGFIGWWSGNVSGYSGGLPYYYADFCVDNTTLIEYYCTGNYAYFGNVSCTGNYTGCAGGACY